MDVPFPQHTHSDHIARIFFLLILLVLFYRIRFFFISSLQLSFEFILRSLDNSCYLIWTRGPFSPLFFRVYTMQRHVSLSL